MRVAMIATAILLSGCGAKPIESANTGNSEVTADLIARIGSCNLYRVYDYGSRVYLAECSGSSSRTEWNENCGKGCTRRRETISPKIQDTTP